jgi:D-glycero-alpha-D-manno-heptose 1-phosphate guanylyltransferase
LQAIILAGGLGTRLRTIVTDKPKALVGINGKPFLEYQLEFLKKYRITDIIICTGYLGEKVESYFSNGERYGVSIRYSRERDLLGTGGALKNASSMLNHHFFVLNGDTIFQTNLHEMKNFHERNYADATIALTRVSDQSRYGSVTCEDKNTISNERRNKITAFSEKSNTSGLLISAGIYLMEKSLFAWNELPDIFSIENDFLPQVVLKSSVHGFVDINAYFVDIGTLEGYRKFNEDIKFSRVSFD